MSAPLRPPARARNARGFTLIELMIALGMALTITASAVTVMVISIRAQHEGTVRSELSRDAQLVMDYIGRDLAYLGAGVPRGFEGTNNGLLVGIGETTSNATTAQLDGAAAGQLRPPIRIGESDYVAFLGDAPYPNAELNGIVGVVGFDTTNYDVPNHKPAVVSELSPCTPPGGGGGYTCDTQTATLIQDISGSGDPCDGSNSTEPTCPWGLNKWQDTEDNIPLVFGALDGTWYRRNWSPTGRNVDGGGARTYLHLEHDPNAAGAGLPAKLFVANGMGGGMAATVDRLFLSLEDGGSPGDACGGWPCTLWRNQCWGWDITATNPNDANFPSVGGTVMRSDTSPADCAAPDQGTGWQPIMSDIVSLTFDFYRADDLDTPLSLPLDAGSSAQARVVEVNLHMKREIPGSSPARFFEHRVRRRFWLENGGGLVTFPQRTTLSSGGCYQTADLPNECDPQ